MPESKWSAQQGYRIRLETEVDFVCLGETIEGRVRIESTASRPVQVPKASVWLWSGAVDDSGARLTPRQDVFDRLDLAPGESRAVDFSLPVKGFGFIFGQTFLSVTAGNPVSAFFKHLTVPVRVLPERRFVELVETLARVSGHEVTQWDSIGGGDGVHARLSPRSEMRSLFDGLRVELYPDGGALYGQLTVDPRDRSLAGVLRAATFADAHRYRLRFSATELPFAAKEFERLLRPFISKGRHLPIPTDGEARDELPRASQPPAPDPAGLPIADPCERSERG